MTPLEELLKEIDSTITGLNEWDVSGHILWNQFRDMVVKKINEFTK